jgi:heme oxygenase
MQTQSDGSNPKFLDELRQYAMALHTKEQAPGSGKAPSPKKEERKPFVPTKAGYLRFMEESKVVYDAFEEIVATDARYERLRNNGLERGPALEEDIEYAVSTWNLSRTAASSDSPGSVYAAMLRDLAVNNPPAFICHYYNFYFAHTAGGRMIGKQVSEAALDGWMGKFYAWEGTVSALLNGVRDVLNEMAETWSDEEKKASMEETPETFKMAGSLMRLMASE